MSSTKGSAVSYAESINITATRVGEFIEQTMRGKSPELLLASPDDTRHLSGPQETESYAFAIVDRSLLKEVLTRLTLMSRKYAGELWFISESRKASHKKWVLEVFGREYVDLFRELAARLAERFEVEIHVRLQSEQTRSDDDKNWW